MLLCASKYYLDEKGGGGGVLFNSNLSVSRTLSKIIDRDYDECPVTLVSWVSYIPPSTVLILLHT